MGREETKQIIAGYKAASILPACKAYANYAMAAELLYETPQVLDIKSKPAWFYEGFKEEPLPVFGVACKFFALCAPSGSGKTQMCFSLRRHKDLKVVHVCLAQNEGTAGATCRLPRGEALSQLVTAAIEMDYQDWRAGNNASEGTELRAKDLIDSWTPVPLRIVALLAEMLGFECHTERIATVKELRRAIIASVKAGERLPVLLIDEAFAHEEFVCAVKFLRTVAGVSAIATIVMGTSTNIVLSPDQWERSYVTHTARPPPWCELLTDLPDYRPVALSHLGSDADPVIMALATDFPRVHPRILLTLMSAARGHKGSIEDCLAVTAMSVREQLSALSTISGVRAQVQYLLNSTIADKTGALIGGHFARLPSVLHGTTLVCDQGVVCLPPSDRWWIPKPEFPSLQEDPLLSLLLAGPCVRARTLVSNGCAHPPPFAIGGSVILTSAAAAIATLDHTETPSQPNRPVQGGVSTFLESVTALAVINASRAGCLGRTPAELFLRHYVTELQARAPVSGPLQWATSGSQYQNPLREFWTQADTWTIPWVARVERSLATAVGIPALGVMPYLQVHNGDRIKGRVDKLHAVNSGAVPAVPALVTFVEGSEDVVPGADDVARVANAYAALCACAECFCSYGDTLASAPGDDALTDVASASDKPALGLLTVSSWGTYDAAILDATLARRWSAVLAEISVVALVPDATGRLIVHPFSVPDGVSTGAGLQPKDRLLCVVVCDERHIRSELPGLLGI
jgi:hypothetical protein